MHRGALTAEGRWRGLSCRAKVIQERLGPFVDHRLTLDTYGHLFPRG